MSQELSLLYGGVVPFIIAIVTMNTISLPNNISLVLATMIAILGVIIWLYSPLPNRTTFGTHPAPGQGYWGITRPDTKEDK